MLSSARVLDVIVAACAGVLLALTLPRTQAAWLAPIGAAALFWTWQRASWKRAFLLGWLAGSIYLIISYAWWVHTVGSFLGIFAPLLVLIPSIVDALTFGGAGVLAVLAYQRAPAALAPLAAAAVFAVGEWVRSVGVVGIPFAQLGYSQADTPLIAIAAYAGSYGVTFVIAVTGAYVADAVVRRKLLPAATALALVAICWAAAWTAWPARHLAPPTMRVAAVQGNIAQSLKWAPETFGVALQRYMTMTAALKTYHPKLIVWPETVVSTILNQRPRVVAEIGRMARSLHATLVVGSLSVHDGGVYNSLYIFKPDGTLDGIYDKRQMVPFAEAFPGRSWLFWLPFSNYISNFSVGHTDAVFKTAPYAFAPLICWESAFADLAYAQMRNGAQLLVISTDDAWFGETAGPHQHAQIAQVRAVETGTWVVRAASTGISGIIAPDGRYVTTLPLDQAGVVTGLVGPPVPTLFARIGPTIVIDAFAVLYLAIVAIGFLMQRRRRAV
jgi:apolipoprotein N-acyltransferase